MGAILVNHCRKKRNTEYMREIGFYEDVTNALLNLHIAMNCDAFVGSMASNWVRWVALESFSYVSIRYDLNTGCIAGSFMS
jgi:hypothetical protein